MKALLSLFMLLTLLNIYSPQAKACSSSGCYFTVVYDRSQIRLNDIVDPLVEIMTNAFGEVFYFDIYDAESMFSDGLASLASASSSFNHGDYLSAMSSAAGAWGAFGVARTGFNTQGLFDRAESARQGQDTSSMLLDTARARSGK